MMVIKKYKVENNLAVPVNPYTLFTNSNDCTNDKQSNDENWNNYNDFAKANTFHTNAQDGVYDADCFGEVVWQYEIENEPEFWFSSRDQTHFKKGFHEYNEYMMGIGCKGTRQFLTFNPMPKMETTELPSPEKTIRTHVPIEEYDKLRSQLDRQIKHKETIKQAWLSTSETKLKWIDAIKEYFDSEHTETIQSFDDFKEQFDLD